jgi:hypothetical protein
MFAILSCVTVRLLIHGNGPEIDFEAVKKLADPFRPTGYRGALRLAEMRGRGFGVA